METRPFVTLCLSILATCLLSQGCAASDSELTRIPFRPHMNLIIVKARIGESRPLNFLVDTGIGNIILDTATAEELGVQASGSRKASTTSGKGELTIQKADSVAYTFGNHKAQFNSVLVMQFQNTARMFAGETIHGVLGQPFLKAFTVEIDYDQNEVILHSPSKYAYDGKATVLPLRFNPKVGNLPFTTVTIESSAGIKHDVSMLVDSGGGVLASCGIGDPNTVNLIVPEDSPRIQTMSATGLADSAADTTHASFLTRLHAMWLGPHRLNRPAVGCGSGPKVNLFGGEVLHRFNIVFDYQRNRMIIEPNSQFNDPVRLDAGGMMLVAKENDVNARVVQYVSPRSPAAEAGILAGDSLTKIDGKPASSQSLHATRELFFQEGQRYQIQLQRGEAVVHVELNTRKLF